MIEALEGPAHFACILAAPGDQLPSTLQDDRLSGDRVEARDADRSAVGGAAGKDGRSPGGDRDLPGCEAIAQRRDERAGDLVVERTTPAIELRDDELVRSAASDDLLAVDVVWDLDRPDRQRRIGRSRCRSVADR